MIGKDLVYDLGRNRRLSISNLGNPNEVMFVGELNENKTGYSDLVCLHNWDYDKFLTLEKLKNLLSGIVGKKFA